MNSKSIDLYLRDICNDQIALQIVETLGTDFDYDNEPVVTINFDISEKEEPAIEFEDQPSVDGKSIYWAIPHRGWRK